MQTITASAEVLPLLQQNIPHHLPCGETTADCLLNDRVYLKVYKALLQISVGRRP